MNKILVSIVIDNSASMKDRMPLLKEAISLFKDNVKANHPDEFEYALVIFDGLNSKSIKTFDQKEFDENAIEAYGVPLVKNSLSLSLDQIEQRLAVLEKEGHFVHKPWLVLLTDNQNFTDLKEVTERLLELRKAAKITYFPFRLSDTTADETLIDIFKIMPPLTIINNQFDKLFEWLYNTVSKRITLPKDQTFTLDLKGFEGWVRK